MCSEHPFHSLHQVYCLKPSAESASATNRRLSARLEVSFSQTERAAAAGDIFDRLRTDTSTGQRVRDVELVCDASLQWAKYPVKSRLAKGGSGPFTMPGNLTIRQLRDVQVPVTTFHTLVDPTMQYKDCVWISRYEGTFETAGGINLPKISYCLGSDGVIYKQLVRIRFLVLFYL